MYHSVKVNFYSTNKVLDVPVANGEGPSYQHTKKKRGQTEKDPGGVLI